MCADRRSYLPVNNEANEKEISSVTGIRQREGQQTKLPPVIRRQLSGDGGGGESVFHTARSNLSGFEQSGGGGDDREVEKAKSISQPLLYWKMVDDNDGDQNGKRHVFVVNEEKKHSKKNYVSLTETKMNGPVDLDVEKGDQLVFDKEKLENDRKENIGNHIPVSKPLAQAQISAASAHSVAWPTQEQLENFATREKHKKAKRYYQKQVDLVKNFQEDKAFVDKFTQDEDEVKRELRKEIVSRSDDILAKLSLIANICLLAAKSVAAALSGSLVVIGTVVDSATDITAGLVIYLTNRAIVKRDMYKYPRGRTRLQPIALVIISVIMGACSVQVMSKSLESIITGKLDIDVELPTIIIMISTIVTKFCLMVACYMYRSPACSVLAQDHRNDVISNSVALICAYLANRFWKYLDPVAAIVVSCYILITWLRTGNEHVKALSGKAAKPEFINRIVKICLDHRPPLKQIDTVLAYHYGTKYLVEIDVVLDKNLSLKDAHDIAEPLQRKIEHLPDVERAFVHIDYETDHRPDYEHKVV